MRLILWGMLLCLYAVSAHAEETEQPTISVTVSVGETMHLVCHDLVLSKAIIAGFAQNNPAVFIKHTNRQADGTTPCFSVRERDIVALHIGGETVTAIEIAEYQLGLTANLVAYRSGDQILSGFMLVQTSVTNEPTN